MSNRLRQVACVSACILMTPLAAHALQATQPLPQRLPAARRASEDVDRMIGTWQGVLAVGAFRERLAFAISRDSTGALRGTMKALDQGGIEVPAAVIVRADTLWFTIAAEHISYSGTMTAAGDSVRGTFTQGTTTIPLTIGRSAGGLTSFGRPQDPKPPFPYHTEEVTVPSEASVRLAGTVVIPNGTGPFPAVVFVTGSGPQDRDEALMGHRPFLVIADYLARHGIASLRYDDRGFAKSTGKFATATSADFAADAEAALHFLQRMPGIARDHVGILGHSEGGLIGPMIAARTRDVAFLVLMAGPGMPGDSLSLLQLRRLAGSGAPTAQVDAKVANNRRIFRAITGARDSADAFARVMVVKQEILATLPEDQRATAASRFDQALPTILAPWMRYFLAYDPRVALRDVHVPVLALGGTLDLQVPAKENLSGIDSALKSAGNKDYRVVELPNLNHLFQTATTGAPSEYATIEETIAPQVLELITSWINQRFAPNGQR
jgi:pimeloyl-ACP methyl ester carboxylesterase